jgi:leucyl-tRNA synthetase
MIIYISKLKDWLFARQRYWGEPFPLVYMGKELKIVKSKDLPVKLPLVKLYGGYTLKSRFYKNWSEDVALGVKRETDTMPQWAGSCWYYLRYLDPKNKTQPWSLKLDQYWSPVDLYVGGSEHAVLHLLYARFWHKVLYDCRLVNYPEPFNQLFNQGVVLATSYKDKQGKYYYYKDVYCKYNNFYLKEDGRSIELKIEKMSKSKFNVYNPNSFIKTYGADAFRLHVLFLGPLDQSIIWHNQSIKRMFKTLLCTHEIFCKFKLKNEHLIPQLINVFKQVNFNNLHIKFNINISLFMEIINSINRKDSVSISILTSIVKLFHPYIPFSSSELWQKLGEFSELSYENWDKFSYLKDKKRFMVLQIRGKVKERIEVFRQFENIASFIKTSNSIRKYIKDKHVVKIVYISQRIINIIL